MYNYKDDCTSEEYQANIIVSKPYTSTMLGLFGIQHGEAILNSKLTSSALLQIANYPGLEGYLNGMKGKITWKRLISQNHGVASVPITLATSHIHYQHTSIQHYESGDKLRKIEKMQV
jgi:hypothetical protein